VKRYQVLLGAAAVIVAQRARAALRQRHEDRVARLRLEYMARTMREIWERDDA
jgi:hypothetical protein